MYRLFALCAAPLALSGCFKIDYVNGPRTGPEQTIWHHRLVIGIVELPGPVRLYELCPMGMAAVHTEVSVLTGLVGILANSVVGGFPLYNPSSIQVWCNSGAAYDATLDQEGMVVEVAPIPGAMSPDYGGGSIQGASGTSGAGG